MSLNPPVMGCSGCASTTGINGCLFHGPQAKGPVALAMEVRHHHVWRYGGSLFEGGLLYHCDDHDPPVVRVVPLREVER